MINEWEDEPDYLRFTEDTTGWECIIKRTKGLGILCGYVVIPKESILYNKHYDDELFNNIMVHGGLTYSEYEETDDEYLIGFDCGHLDDLAPYRQDLYQGTYKNIAYVEYMCLRLARQLYELSNTLTKSKLELEVTIKRILRDIEITGAGARQELDNGYNIDDFVYEIEELVEDLKGVLKKYNLILI